LGTCAVLIAAVWAAQGGTPLDIKPGQWETTVTISRSGAPPLPPEVLARIPAEQRAQMEQRMKASAAQGPQTHVTKSCLTKEDLAKSFGAFNSNPNCKQTIVSSSARSADFKLECINQGMVTTGTGHVDAIDSEHTSGKSKMTMAAGGQTSTSEVTFSSKWLGATCADNKK
jgi:hypothetical protein